MKVAVVGSGCSGLGATWLLNEFSDHDVHLFEADSRLGGHANTVLFTRKDIPGSPSVDVDTGFIVLNPYTYPNFLRFLKWASIDVVPTEMTFSVSRDRGKFEWAGKGLFTFFCQPTNLLDINMWRLIYEILRFNASARALLVRSITDPRVADLSIGSYLESEGYSPTFIRNYLVPMTACIWSTPPGTCFSDFPALTLVKFMNNHHLLQLTGKPPWMTIPGGSRTYVQRIASHLPDGRIHLNSAVSSISSTDATEKTTVTLTCEDGRVEAFDHVILACHSDTALSLLHEGGGITPEEESILGSFEWSENTAILHYDTSLMPLRESAWSCWNFLSSSGSSVNANDTDVSLTYYMNELQHISRKKFGPVLVSLNPLWPPDASKTLGEWRYDHPVVSGKSTRAQTLVRQIQNTRGISYAGAYLGYGFHEDGFTSGLVAATQHLGAHSPFTIKYPDRSPGSLVPAKIFQLIESLHIARVLFYFLEILLDLCKRILRI